MPFVPPTLDDLRHVSKQLGLRLADADLESFRVLLTGASEAYAAVDAMPDYVPPVK